MRRRAFLKSLVGASAVTATLSLPLRKPEPHVNMEDLRRCAYDLLEHKYQDALEEIMAHEDRLVFESFRAVV